MRRVKLEAGTSMEFKLSQISLFKSKKKDHVSYVSYTQLNFNSNMANYRIMNLKNGFKQF